MSVLRSIISGLPEAMRGWRGARLTLLSSAGFWRGKQFRLYRELGGTDTTLHFRFVATKPFHLQYQGLTAYTGDIRISVFTGATFSGTWTDTGAIQSKYRVGMDPVSTAVFETGGTATGGTEREVLRAKGGSSGQGNAQQALQQDSSTRALPAGTYYIRVGLVGTCDGMYILEHEDLNDKGM